MGMEFLYKPDWEAAKERLLAWWEGELINRCVVSVTAAKNNPPDDPRPLLPEKTEDRWLDLDYISRRNEYHMRRTFYGGESLPVWNAGYPGWDMLQTYLGTPIKLDEHTGWHSPMIAGGKLTDYDYNKFKIAPDNKWWLFSQKVHKLSKEQSRGKCFPGLHDLGYSGDILAAMRGTENLLLDLIECPEYVAEFDKYLIKLFMIFL